MRRCPFQVSRQAPADVTCEAQMPSGAREPQLPIDRIRPYDRGWPVLDRIAEAPGVLPDVCTEGMLEILRSRTEKCFCGERVTSARSQARCASGAN